MRYYFKSKTMTGFKFKQFEIHQDRCAMKVGTDGVLLGAWALLAVNAYWMSGRHRTHFADDGAALP